MRPLTLKQELFCKNFIENGFNKAEAYRFAFNCVKMKNATIIKNASNLSRKPHIAARIEELKSKVMAKLDKDTEITMERVRKELGRIGFFDVRKLYKPDGTLKNILDLDDDTACALGSIEVEEKLIIEEGEEVTISHKLKKIKAADKKGALDSLAKHLGMFAPVKHEVAIEITPDEMSITDVARRVAFLLERGSLAE